jgi:histidinol dehydrogenase
MKVRVAAWSSARRSKVVESFLQRPAFDEQAERTAGELLADIQRRGEAAVMAAAAKFDGVSLRATELRLTERELDSAIATVPETTRRHVREAHRRVTEFSRRGLRQEWRMPTAHGGSLGETYTPYERIGIYVPGGTAPLASTVVMTATLAQVAGVREIVACTPCRRDKCVNPVVLYAMQVAGVTEVYRVGGVQAIGMMAYGTQHAAAVQKIVGPGGAFVTAAKRLVYGTVALDLVAGPSEIAVLADASANPAWVAADLLSQAEHGTGHEKALLVTDSPPLADAVLGELAKQAAQLTRRALVRKVADAGGLLLVTVPSLEDGLDLVNRFAPEHLELMVKDAETWRAKVRCAGAVFVGHWTPESAGDFVAGPSHVLPTGGAARLFSGLTVDDFRRRTSIVAYTEADLRDALPTIEAFGAMEGLDGHARSARIRCAETA